MIQMIKNFLAERKADKLWKKYDEIEKGLWSISSSSLDTKSMELKHRVSIHCDRIIRLAMTAEMIEKETEYRYNHEKK